MRKIYQYALWAVVLSTAVAASNASVLVAQDVETAKAAGPSVEELQRKAAMIAASYDKLEQLILRMAEIEALTNPQRAALLKRAAQQSAERRTKKQLGDTVALLVPPAKLKRAIDEQERGLADMKLLLELLLSEDRADRLKAQERIIRDQIKEVERLIRLEKSAEGRTRGGADPAKLAEEQNRIAERTSKLADQIRESEEGDKNDEQNESGGESKPKEPSSGDQKPGDQKPGEKKPGEEKPGEEKPGEEKPGEEKPGEEKPGEEKPGEEKPGEEKPGEEKPGEEKPAEPGDPQDGSQSSEGEPQPGESPSGQPQEGQPGESSQQQQQQQAQENENPARKRLEAAEERMREATKRLEEAKRDEAVKEQEKARHELEKAKAELEEILRQLREEEVGRTLAMLEGRFRRMLEKQLEILESTKRLDKIAPDDRGRQVDIQAGKLGFEETKLAVEADKALLLLHEEGSSVAFPETVEMMRDDMQQVADRLSSTKIDPITQGIEEEIITTLEEMIAALQQAQQDLEEKKQQPQQQGQPQQPGEEPLVDQIAELKMIRALQMRVNTRTTRYARLLANGDELIGQADDEELRESLVALGERQDRIHEVTKDIVLGKNK